MRADGEAALDVVVVDRLGAGEQRGRDGRGRRPLAAGAELALPDGAHLGDRPGEIDGGRSRRRQAGGGLVEGGGEGRRVVGCRDAAAAPAKARPPAAVTPIAGAPRTVMSLMRAATSRQVRQCT